jgi:dCTP deaminase
VSRISYNGLITLVERGVISPVDLKDVHGVSIDVHLGSKILVERKPGSIVSLRDKEALLMDEVDITGGYYDLAPGEFILGHTIELFTLPDNISITLRLNSSSARVALEHLMATLGDPYWVGRLTLELVNMSRYHTLRLHDGVRIGQILFDKCKRVPKDRGYAARGRYQNNMTVQGVINK